MKSKTRASEPVTTVLTFPSELGWMGVVLSGDVVRQLTFGHGSAAAAKEALDEELLAGAKPGGGNHRLVRRLQAYASGKPDSLADVAVDLSAGTSFRRRVLEQCRRVPYGKTISYAALAAKAGSPGAARAVGNCMAGNRIPLLIPCHRVVSSGGKIGSFSAPGGVEMKRRILRLESKGVFCP
jgi:methylated-DNA-[protein]-cysteine S-methyltransferase